MESKASVEYTKNGVIITVEDDSLVIPDAKVAFVLNSLSQYVCTNYVKNGLLDIVSEELQKRTTK